MPTVIRLKRGGRKHLPCYRVVVVDSRSRNRGTEVDSIGYYNPSGRPDPIAEVNVDKAREWLAKGARPSETVRTILSKKGLLAERACAKKSSAEA